MDIEIAFALVTLVVFLGGVFLYGFYLYRGIMKVKGQMDYLWASVDAAMRERYDEVPKLLRSMEDHLEYEQGSKKKIQEAHQRSVSARTMSDRASSNSALSGALDQIFMLAEKFPDIKANTEFLQSRQRVHSLEENIADRRDLYNTAANRYNDHIRNFPEALVARVLRLKNAELFRFTAEDRTDVSLRFRKSA